jgi:FlaG/FlaF family flagellin (archaellin)
MKRTIILAATVAFAGTPALAQSAQPTPQAETMPQTQTQAPEQRTQIRAVSVVDVSDLPEESQTQISQIEAERSEGQLEALRTSIEGSPALVDALEKQGATPSDVVAASLSETGTLTILTRKET